MRTKCRSNDWVLGWLFVLAGAALLRLLGIGGTMTHLRAADVVLGPAVLAYTVCIELERRQRAREEAELAEMVAAWRSGRRSARAQRARAADGARAA